MRKFTSIVLCSMLMVMLFASQVFAFSYIAKDDEGGSTGASNGGSYSLGTEVNVQAPGGAGEIVARIVGVMQWIGYAVAIAMLVYIGIKYVMASANEKADLKNSLIKYVIGAALIIFAVTIADAIFSINS